ncbi:hypothetical protein BDZ85DRAFT_224682 [Elsinoe ampelina]|uniref:P-loop containing nucleoside triphosphate hydrolase protein n=1 Tax=Elsinoe ampelina TaxID=302913 RepID=A0A6A6G291_9PEZI|nr:hypothetical protein BDZ85DRAFT_224682 [Elsinoe ampelina]
MTTLLFSLVVQTVQNARITPAYQDIFDRLVAVAEHPDDANTHADIDASRRYLREAAASLEHGKDVPFLQQQITRSASSQTATFHLARAGPGEHGDSPARHDNDKEDIQDIQILPTYQEIVSTLPEYLPLLDEDTWHKAGVQGLLDRNFRLLREDTIGQLRDTVRTELDRVNQQVDTDGSKLHRHWSLDNVSIEAPYFDPYRGLEVVATFDQPEHIHDMTLKERKTHWEHSRRLQPDSVVCLLTSQGKLIFCHVTREFRDTRGKKKEDDRFPPPSRASVSLVNNPRRASVLLRPVDLSPHSVGDLIYVHALGGLAGDCTLVEFPGVLLPAFMPTLQALQTLSKSGTIPFSEFLTSTERGDQQAMSPPVYATLPDFSFDLNIICADDKPMAFDPNNITTTDRRQLTDSSRLDPSQSQTLLDALSRRLALLQGPPGTGKSFVGVHLARVLVAAKKKAGLGPVICVCYTNHALDQLLEHLLDNGITQVIRMGSASKSERVSKLNIRDLAKKDDVTKVEKHEMWKCRVAMEGEAIKINAALQQLHGCGTAQGLRQFLQSFNPDHATQLFGAEKADSEWVEQKSKKNKSPQKRLHTWLNGGRKPGPHTTDRTEDELFNIDLSNMSHQERACIHQAWIKTMFDQEYESIEPARAAFVRARDRLQIVRSELDLRVLEQADIIGLTTSGLARNLPTLRKLSSKVLLCEEAGEVLEAHLLTALMPQIEHAILIGDHLQLRPHVQYQLSRESREGEKYSLDLSLFERLVGQGEGTGSNVPYSTLHTQRRMHPTIAELVRSTLYPSLVDEPPAYAPVQGMQKRLFWFDHDNREASNQGPGGTHASHSNDFEVEMVTALVSHLIKQGQRRPDEIAVLTPYLGQLRKLRASLSDLFELLVDDRDEEDLERAGLADAPTTSLISKTSLAQAVRVATVDNFQGEEAPIVVISLVRSNERHQCGFLKTSNRINVLLSRAQQGMYIIGDAATCAGVPMWKDVIDIMDANDNIGHALPIECPRHEEHKMEVEIPDDFLRLAPDGGCHLPCPKRLDCGHACPSRCHSNFRHDAVKCLQPCPRREGDFQNCDHECPKLCGDTCPSTCQQLVDGRDISFPCGHVAQEVSCWISRHPEEYVCRATVTKTVPGCGHEVAVACCASVDTEKYQCREKCGEILACGHTCLRPCSMCNTRENGIVVKSDHDICIQICDRAYNACPHSCAAKCHGDTPCPPCNRPCEMQCSHSKCDKKCSEPCPPCAEAQCSSACPHAACSQPCAAPCDWVPCSKRCEQLLDCGHQCPSLCGERCPPTKLCQTCCDEDVKQTQVDLIMFSTYSEVDLDDTPCIFLPCGHILTVESMDGLVGLANYYEIGVDGHPTAARDLPYALDIDQAKINCPTCRKSLRNTARCGRPIRSALLIQSTLKFITWSNTGYVNLMNEFLDLKAELAAMHDFSTITPTDLDLKGGNDAMVKTISQLPGSNRYQRIVKFRKNLSKFARQVQQSEQPFRKVQDLVTFANRRKASDDQVQFTFPASSVLQTKSSRMAACLILRSDLLIITDYLTIHRNSPGSSKTTRTIDTSVGRKRCEELITICASGKHPMQEAECHLFLAQFATIEVNFPSATDAQDDRVVKENWDDEHPLRHVARAHLDSAHAIHAALPAETKALAADLELTEKMLTDGVFYSDVSDEEIRAVVTAMEREFRSTGHWYRCPNGHPFTVGECGGPMQLARCSECGAEVGGQHHVAAEGVTRAGDLGEIERGVQRIQIHG